MKEKLTPEQFLQRATCSNLAQATLLKTAAFHHIDSFNYIYDTGLQKLVQYIQPIEIIKDKEESATSRPSFLPFKNMKIWFEDL